MLLIPRLALTVRTRLRRPNTGGVRNVIIVNRVDVGEVGRFGRADGDVFCH